MSKLRSALAHAKAGWPVAPCHNVRDGRCSCGDQACRSPGKHPIADLVPHGLKDATTDAAQIRQWWKAWPDANIAGRCDGLAVMDVDVARGKRGRETLADLEKQYASFRCTLVQRTGSGGEHHVFAAREGVKYPSKLGDGIDLKCGPGAYIMLAGSDHVSGGVYEWKVGDGADAAVLDSLHMAPKWFSAERERKAESNDLREALRERDRLPGKKIKAILAALPDEYLESYQEWLSVGMALHHHYAGDVRGRHYWDWFSRDSSTYDAAEIDAKWKSFESDDGGVTIGTLIEAAGGWGRIVERKEKQARGSGLTFYSKYDDIAPAFDFVPGVLQDHSVAFIYGAPESGKTFYGVHLLCSVALGRKVFGLQTEQRNGLYVGLEGVAGIKTRLMAWCLQNGVDALPIRYALGSFDILDEDQRARLVEYMKEHAIRFVVIDTLAKTMVGSDESTAKEMSPVIDGLHQIMMATGACVTCITHTGKDASAGIRGWSGQLGAADTTIEIVAHAEPGKNAAIETPRTARVRKQKDIDRAPPVSFILKLHETPVLNGRGEKVRSPAVDEHHRFPELEGAEPSTLTAREQQAFDVIKRLCRYLGASPRSEIRTKLRREKWGPTGDDAWGRAFRRTMEALEAKGRIQALPNDEVEVLL